MVLQKGGADADSSVASWAICAWFCTSDTALGTVLIMYAFIVALYPVDPLGIARGGTALCWCSMNRWDSTQHRHRGGHLPSPSTTNVPRTLPPNHNAEATHATNHHSDSKPLAVGCTVEPLAGIPPSLCHSHRHRHRGDLASQCSLGSIRS